MYNVLFVDSVTRCRFQMRHHTLKMAGVLLVIVAILIAETSAARRRRRGNSFCTSKRFRDIFRTWSRPNLGLLLWPTVFVGPKSKVIC